MRLCLDEVFDRINRLVAHADMVFMVLCIAIPVIALTTAIRFGCFESIGT